MSLDKNQIEHIEKLASLSLSDDEKEKYSSQLSQILDYMSQLKQVNTDLIEPSFNVSDPQTNGREDAVGNCLSQEETLQNASRRKNGFFVVKSIFEE